MPTATRFTTKYEAAEDRIKLMLELSEDEVQVLWLTRRLMSRMLPHLIKHLGQTGGGAASVDSAPQDGKAGAAPAAKHTDAVQRFNQEAAVSAIERQPGVGAGGQKPAKNLSYLVTSVDLRTGPRSVVLDFKSGEEILHSLPFGEDALRQWLSILCSQYKAAGWQEGFWPAWLRPVDAPATPQDDLLLN